MKARRVIAVATTTGLLLAACGDDDATVQSGDPTTTTTPASGTDQVYEADTTVLESEEHGPQLCLGGTLDSYPPQCGGPDVEGWDWAAVDGEEAASGTTWGSYHVVGTFDGTTFTLTETPTAPDPDAAGDDAWGIDFTAPCDPPAGGWAVVDPATTTQAALDAAGELARGEPDYAGHWVDRPADSGESDEGVGANEAPADEAAANDPTKLVLVMRFTGDLERHEAELRAVWGGALCVTGAERTEAELRAIQDEVMAEVDGFLSAGTDVVANAVTLGVIVDDGIQTAMDDRYGEGAVKVIAALRPTG